MPGVRTKKPGLTFYRGYMSSKGKSPGALMRDGFNHKTTFAQITDGLSNTILCIEADEPCIWTKPDDIPFDPMGTITVRGGRIIKDRCMALMCDGSVRMLDSKMPEARLKGTSPSMAGKS